jgi:tetrahydromethanopterin S-methyltransferase subunit G
MMIHHDSPSEAELKKIVMTRVTRLDAVLHGIVTGLIVGVAIFIATNWLVLKGGDVVGPHMALLGQFFIGYQVTLLGSFIGLAYGFVAGFVLGYVVAALYNWLLSWRGAQH